VAHIIQSRPDSGALLSLLSLLSLRKTSTRLAGAARKVDVRLPGKGNSNSHGERPVHLIITMIKWIRTSRLTIQNSLSAGAASVGRRRKATSAPRAPVLPSNPKPLLLLLYGCSTFFFFMVAQTSSSSLWLPNLPKLLLLTGSSSSLLFSSLELSDTQVYEP